MPFDARSTGDLLDLRMPMYLVVAPSDDIATQGKVIVEVTISGEDQDALDYNDVHTRYMHIAKRAESLLANPSYHFYVNFYGGAIEFVHKTRDIAPIMVYVQI